LHENLAGGVADEKAGLLQSCDERGAHALTAC